MGALFLARSDDSGALDAARRVLARQGFRAAEERDVGRYRLIVHPRFHEDRAAVAELPSGDFAAAAGTFVFDGKRDEAALRAFLDVFDGDLSLLDRAIGPFALAVRHADGLTVTTDRAGGFPLFTTGTALSTSFLALAAGLARPTLDHQAVDELVLTGAPLGDSTPVSEITRAPAGGTVRAEGTSLRLSASASVAPAASDAPFEEHLRRVDERLDAYVGEVAAAFDGRTQCAITGGYDSRLIFALLRRCDVTPRALIYPGDARNVRVAREVAAAEGVHLDVIERPTPVPSPDELPALVEHAFLLTDGWSYQGLFTGGDEAAMRLDRTRDSVFFHGGGGEVLRNFFRLPDRGFTARAVAMSLYAKFDPGVCRSRAAFREYVDGVAAKIETAAGATGRLSRQQIEWLYPHFRCRAWFGRDNGLNNWAGASVMPFFDGRVLEVAEAVPLRHKRHGAFEAALIARARPRVAAVRSQYGHDFASPPGRLHRAKDLAVDHVPPAARPLLHVARQRRRPPAANAGYLADAGVRTVLPGGVQRLAGRFVPARMDTLQRSRLLSVEYLAAELDAAI